MRVFAGDSHGPLKFQQIPPEIQSICNSLLDGLRKTLDDNLFGIYFYGAMVFPETRYTQDIDFHVILRRKLTVREKEAIKNLHNSLATKFPALGDETGRLLYPPERCPDYFNTLAPNSPKST
jgi:hypothetical protein